MIRLPDRVSFRMSAIERQEALELLRVHHCQNFSQLIRVALRKLKVNGTHQEQRPIISSDAGTRRQTKRPAKKAEKTGNVKSAKKAGKISKSR